MDGRNSGKYFDPKILTRARGAEEFLNRPADEQKKVFARRLSRWKRVVWDNLKMDGRTWLVWGAGGADGDVDADADKTVV